MVLALNVGLVDPKYGSALENKPDDVDAEIEIAKAIRLRKMKQTPASEQKDPIFGVSMGETARAVKGENKTGVEGFVRGFAAKPFQMLGGMLDLGQMAAKDPLGTGKKIVGQSAKGFKQAMALANPTGGEFGASLAAEGADLQEQGLGGYTFDKLMELAGAAGAGQGIGVAVKAARAAKTAGGITKAFRAFANGAIKAAPEITPEAAAKVFTEATEQAVTPEMLDALKGKFNNPAAGATSVGKSMSEPMKATTSTPPVGESPEIIRQAVEPKGDVSPKSKLPSESLNEAQAFVDADRKAYREKTALLPDGTDIGGWKKETVAGDVFWVKGAKRTSDVMVEAGKKKTDHIISSHSTKPIAPTAKAKDYDTLLEREGANTETLDDKHRFANPIKGKTGAEIIGYKWMSATEEGMFRDKRVSDWERAQTSVPTGRSIVHLYWVRTPDGSEVMMGVGAAQKALGISESRLYSIAKREQQAQRALKDGWDTTVAHREGSASKSYDDATREWRNANSKAIPNQSEYTAYFKNSSVLRKDDKWIRSGDQELIKEMQDRGWVEVGKGHFDPDLAAKYGKQGGESVELGSFGGPGTFKQLGQTISRAAEKMGGGGKPKDAPGIRLDNINVSDDIKTNVKARLDDVAKQISDKKGAPLSHEEILDRAVEADLLKGFVDREKTADVAASLTRTQQNLAALAEQNPVGIDPDWAKQATSVSSMATDLGRRLNALKIPVKSELYEFKMKMIKELTDRGHDLDTIVRVFDGVDFTNAKAVGKAYKTMLPKMEKVRLWIDKFRYTNMLSGPKTHIINQTGNVLQSLVIRPVDRFNWGVLDFGRSKLTGAAREAYATDFIPYYRGFVGSAKDGAKAAFDVLRGKNKIEKPDLDLTQLPLGGAYTPVEVIPRLMEAADVFTRTMMEGAEMKLGASSGVARSTANTYLFRNLPDTANKTGQGLVAAVFDRATAVAEYLRKDFTIQSGGKPVHVWNPMKLMIPFVQTPMNILKEGMIARNPLLGSVNLVGNTAKMESVAKMMTGGMILAAAGAYAYNNRVSYTAPTSQKGKQMFYGAGLKPYSIITPDGHSVSMQRLGPVAYPFVLASATKWYFDKNPKAATESNLEKTSQILTAYAKFLTDQSYMQGIGSVLDALEGEGKLVRAATGPARQFIPLSSLQSWVNDYFLDPVYRKPSNNFDAEGIAENMYRSMIGMSKKLEPYRDSEERKEKRQNPTLNAFSPVEISKINRDKRGEYNEYLAGQRERAIEKKQAR